MLLPFQQSNSQNTTLFAATALQFITANSVTVNLRETATKGQEETANIFIRYLTVQ